MLSDTYTIISVTFMDILIQSVERIETLAQYELNAQYKALQQKAHTVIINVSTKNTLQAHIIVAGFDPNNNVSTKISIKWYNYRQC